MKKQYLTLCWVFPIKNTATYLAVSASVLNVLTARNKELLNTYVVYTLLRDNIADITFFLQSHAGKVVLRSWYEKNKHIFPASRWEPYDPEKKWDKYTVRSISAYIIHI